MSNISISEIQSVASSLTDNDLLLISKSNGDNTFNSVKCTFDTLFKSIAPCSDCHYSSAQMEKQVYEDKDYTDFTITANKNAYVSIDIHDIISDGNNHVVNVYLQMGDNYNSLDSRIILSGTTKSYFGLGLFATNSKLLIRIPNTIVGDNTRCVCEYTYH